MDGEKKDSKRKLRKRNPLFISTENVSVALFCALYYYRY